MAGIAGIIPKNNSKEKIDLEQAFNNMMSKLAYSENQLNHTISNKYCYAGNVVPTKSLINDHYIKLLNLPYHVFLDGLIYVNDEEKSILRNKYYEIKPSNDYEFVPLLFDYYGEDFVNHISGWYNIFIYDEKKKTHLIINDRLGYLPLYYYDSEEYFIFSSKIEPILASGLMKSIIFDQVTIVEHLFFNYPLSDNTYIKQIFTLPDASILKHDDLKLETQRYWNVSELFNIKPTNKKQSIKIIDKALKQSIEKVFKGVDNPINFSLTGGWDSRVVLSYLLPKYKDKFLSYSFGAPKADDIKVPELISKKEGFIYTPYILDDKYLKNKFLDYADDTIKLSNGSRNYKRTHYLYAIKEISKKSDFLLTGIFGDEVFKVGKPQGGTVISKNTVEFLDSNFDVEFIINKFKNSNLINVLDVPSDELLDELENRLIRIKERFTEYKTSGEQYFAFRFTLNLRKYFGHEVNSYNDFVYCFSPFIDYDFLKDFARTKYMSSHFSFKKPSLKLKAQSSRLYYKLTKLNHKILTEYPSSRAFSMKDTNTFFGLFKIIYSKYIAKNKRNSVDGFNTKATEEKFQKILSDNNVSKNKDLFMYQHQDINNHVDYDSLLYWVSKINKEYLNK